MNTRIAEDTKIAFEGQTIRAIAHTDSFLILTFDGGTLTLSDEGQSCCEYRYMTVEDDLSYYVGAQYLAWEVKDGPSVDDEYDVHEVQFLEVTTSQGTFTVSSHNEHNGYYGGFLVTETVEAARYFPLKEAA